MIFTTYLFFSQKGNEKTQRTGLFFHTVSGHRFTIVRKTTKHVFACETDEQLQNWISKVKTATLAAEGGPASSVSVSAGSSPPTANIADLVKEMTALKMKNTQLKLKKASAKTQAARNSSEVVKSSVIELMLAEMALLRERNAQLKAPEAGNDDTTTSEQAAEVKALVAKVLLAKKRNAELKAGKTAAEIQDCLDRARARKEEKIGELMATLKALRQANHSLKNPTASADAAAEDDEDSSSSGQVPSASEGGGGGSAMDTPTRGTKKGMLRYSMSVSVLPG